MFEHFVSNHLVGVQDNERHALPCKGRVKMNKKERPIKALGEIVLRVRNLKEMQEFYENILGLEIFGEFEKMIFFQIE